MTVKEMNNVIQEHCNSDCDNCVIKVQCSSIYGEFERYPQVCEEAYNIITGNNNVSHPSHYTQGGIECIDAMVAAYGKESVSVFCLLNAFKYLWRTEHKNGKEDLEKAIWYLKKRLELIEDE
jgi:hypothetical protein